MPQKHIIIFSHGFGVRKDDRGLLTDIAAAFPNSEAALFDYFDIHEVEKTLTVRPLSVQVKMLRDVVERARVTNPDAIIDIVAHSQGTVVAAMARPKGVRKVVLLAPPFNMSIEWARQRYGAMLNLNGLTTLPPLDGLARLVPADYWKERETLKTFDEFNALAEQAEMIVIEANRDEIVPKVSLDPLSSKAKLMSLDGDHNFTGPAREPLKKALQDLLRGGKA